MIGRLRRIPRRRLALLLFAMIGLLLAYGLNGVELIRTLDAALMDRRMALQPRRATGAIAFIAIDKASLDQVGVWPWPRSVHARILDRLVEAGVKDIAFDIDFSAKSTPAEDAALAQALARAGGGAILPVFLQASSARTAGAHLALTQPIPALAENAWLGAVNVVPGRDGVLRAMPYGIAAPDAVLPAIPTILAGLDEQRTDMFPLDFSIDPATVPVYSVSRLLSGQLREGALQGKSVVIGAHAIELKDFFTVPVHGTISGPMVQILAAETLIQKRVVSPANPWLTAAALLASLALFFVFRPRRLPLQFVALALVAVAFEVAALYLYRERAIQLQTAAVHLTLLAIAFGRVVSELDVRRWLLKLAALETRNTKQILQQVITDNSDAILVAGEDGTVLEMSVRVSDVFRSGAGSAPGEPLRKIVPARMVAEVQELFAAARRGEAAPASMREIDVAEGRDTRSIEYSITPSRLETPKGPAFIVCIAARDITERRRQAEALDRLSRYDQLTGALRQTEFITRLDKLIEERRSQGEGAYPLAVYSLNLHRFKTINGTLGREVGDILLSTVASTLETSDPGVVLVGRTGGDSFCLARLGHGKPGDAVRFAETLVRTLGIPFILGDNRAKIGVHIGFVSATAGDAPGAAILLDHAEFALDEARAISGSGWCRFDPAASNRIIRSRQVERELWRSLERNEITVAYQPQVTLKERKLLGVEALVRWNHPELGTVSPGDFVEIAEANGFVEKLGQWVLWRACTDAMGWDKPVSVAVNVSPLQFTRGDVVRDVQQALLQSGLPPQRLHLEITESTFLDPSKNLIDKLFALKSLGLTLALDDFGTGYSSFGYLSKFPLDKLKVDQMFIRSLHESEASRAIVGSVRSLCEGLHIATVCEGIETEEELAYLVNIGCEQGQGWLFGKAKPNAEIRDVIRQS